MAELSRGHLQDERASKATSMDRGVKIVLASTLLLAAVAAAMLFRHPSPQARPPQPGSSESLVLRQEGEPPAVELPAPGRLTAEIEPSAQVPYASGTSGQTPRQSPTGRAPKRPGPPPPPPRLARSYPPFPERTTPGWGAPLQPQGPDAKRSGEPARTHKIVDGDTLADLAERYLGEADRYLEIFEANRDLLPSPEVLPIGVELKIPPRRKPELPPSPMPPEKPLVPVAPASSRPGP